MFQRALELNPEDRFSKKRGDNYYNFMNMGRLSAETCKNIRDCRGRLINKKLSSSALGDNYLNYFNMPGRVQIDLLKVVMAGMTKLPSYKLDSVAEYYIGGKVEGVGLKNDESPEVCEWIKVGNIKVFNIGQKIEFKSEIFKN